MALKCFLRFSTAFAIRDMQIKTSLRLILTPVKMAKIIKNKKKDDKFMDMGKGSTIPCWWEYGLVQLLWETVWHFLKKLRNRFGPWFTKPLLGAYTKDCIPSSRQTCSSKFTAANLTVAKKWKHSRFPSLMNGSWKCDTFMQRNITQVLRKMKL